MAWTKQWRDDGWTTEQWRQVRLDPQQFDLEDLEEVRVSAMQRAKACAKKALAKRRAAAKEWAAAALNQGAKFAHRWTGRIGTKPQLAEEVTNGSEHFCTPVDMMASRFKTWVAKWKKTRDSAQETVYGNPGSQEMCEGKSGPVQDCAQGPG